MARKGADGVSSKVGMSPRRERGPVTRKRRRGGEGVATPTVAVLHRLRVTDEQGRVLGRVYDVRTRYDPKQPGRGAAVTALVYGTRGLLEMLGIRRDRGKTLDWSRVVAIEVNRVVVRPAVRPKGVGGRDPRG